jgi:hypothetical protein
LSENKKHLFDAEKFLFSYTPVTYMCCICDIC